MRLSQGRLPNDWCAAALAAAALFALPEPGAAAEPAVGGSLAATSDYIFQGLSRSFGAPAVQGSLEAQYRDWTAGVWASTLGDNPHGDLEVDFYLARLWQLSPDWSTQLAYTHYWYPNDRRRRSYDYDEVSATLGYLNSLYATVSWTPNVSVSAYGTTAWHVSSWAYELTFAQPIARLWSVNAGIGHRDLHSAYGKSYWFGHAGLELAVKSMSLHLTHTRADSVAEHLFGDDIVPNGWSLTALWRFSTEN